MIEDLITSTHGIYYLKDRNGRCGGCSSQTALRAGDSVGTGTGEWGRVLRGSVADTGSGKSTDAFAAVLLILDEPTASLDAET